jgi:hypothetical protein
VPAAVNVELSSVEALVYRMVAFGAVPPAESAGDVMPESQQQLAVQRVSADDDVMIYMVASVGAEVEGLGREPIKR